MTGEDYKNIVDFDDLKEVRITRKHIQKAHSKTELGENTPQ
jgi:hypothetical protein